jgi:2-iminobutanoate/2-iminopropanoate deaminase
VSPLAPSISRRHLVLGAAGATAVGMLPPLAARPALARADTWLASEHPAFAAGARIGDLTFVAQDASGPGEPVVGSLAQAERTLRNLQQALAAVGQGLDDLIFLQVLLTDYAAAPAVADLTRKAFRPERAPTTCFVGVTGLGPGRLIRMDAVASDNPDRAQIVADGVPLPLGAACHAVRVGDLIFSGAVDAPEVAGAPDTGPGTAQSALILDRIDAVLRAGGSSLGHSFRHWQFLRNMQQAGVRDAFTRGRSAKLGAVFAADQYPANSRIGSPALGPGVAQRSFVVATRGQRKYVESNFARKSPRVFAQSVRAGDWLFIAGQDAVDVANQTLYVGDLRSQTEQCVRQLQFIMEAAGGTLDNIVKTTVYLLAGTDRSVFLEAYAKELSRRLSSPWMPAGLTMEVDALRPGCLVEIDAVAWMGASR